MKIEKKVWSEYFDKILSGEKTFELRLADFKCSPGDVLILREWDKKQKQFTGRQIEKNITFVFKTKNQGFWPEEAVNKYGYQIIAFK
ncbi:MAG: DUF3850 domain-containing protein [DPANN group archaeon]|nr:DUF3850 domain-containing protein [DPANN group archaeon]